MRLCELYKAFNENAQAKAEEFTKATKELQRLLKDASGRYGELETESNAEIERLKQQLAQNNQVTDELRKELERANTLLDTSKSRLLAEDAVEAMSPSAAAASRLLKSGMTLTQIYSQYVSVSEQLLLKDEENKRLNSYIDHILQVLDATFFFSASFLIKSSFRKSRKGLRPSTGSGRITKNRWRWWPV